VRREVVQWLYMARCELDRGVAQISALRGLEDGLKSILAYIISYIAPCITTTGLPHTAGCCCADRRMRPSMVSLSRAP